MEASLLFLEPIAISMMDFNYVDGWVEEKKDKEEMMIFVVGLTVSASGEARNGKGHLHSLIHPCRMGSVVHQRAKARE